MTRGRKSGPKELTLERTELLELLLAQEKEKSARLTFELGLAQWGGVTHQRSAQKQEQTDALAQARKAVVELHKRIGKRLSINLDKYAFDDLTGRLSPIEE